MYPLYAHASIRDNFNRSMHKANSSNRSPGLATFFWPPPMLHGRKPCFLIVITLVIPLQLPRALSMPPYTMEPELWDRLMQPYRICLTFFRMLPGRVGIGFRHHEYTLGDRRSVLDPTLVPAVAAEWFTTPHSQGNATISS